MCEQEFKKGPQLARFSFQKSLCALGRDPVIFLSDNQVFKVGAFTSGRTKIQTSTNLTKHLGWQIALAWRCVDPGPEVVDVWQWPIVK